MNEKIFPWDVPDEIRMRKHISDDNGLEVPKEIISIFENSANKFSLDNILTDFENIAEDKK